MKRATIALTLVLSSLVAGAAFAQETAGNGNGCKKDKDVVCPAIFDPVVCDNNKTYSNQCFATADCATGCQPAGTVATATSTSDRSTCNNDGVVCLDIYDPVICNDGVVYGNSCYARAACARGCRPYDDEI